MAERFVLGPNQRWDPHRRCVIDFISIKTPDEYFHEVIARQEKLPQPEKAPKLTQEQILQAAMHAPRLPGEITQTERRAYRKQNSKLIYGNLRAEAS